jgi:hypothetical protein
MYGYNIVQEWQQYSLGEFAAIAIMSINHLPLPLGAEVVAGFAVPAAVGGGLAATACADMDLCRSATE